jgi:hypothetical protein
MATVIEENHDTIIVEHLTRKEVKRVEGHHGLAATLRDFAREQGGDPEEVKSTSFGVRWQHPNGIGYRATYARKKGRKRRGGS